ncbi:MAG: hypothetical protein JJ975_16565 [Bacteroidia bacterium]|nr:hypothetical protein [Bacteroidia bacterium]
MAKKPHTSSFIACFMLILFIASCKGGSTKEVDSDASDLFSNIDWLLGKWARTNDRPGELSFEEWTAASGGFTGLGYTMSGSDTGFRETLSIIAMDSQLNYVAEVAHNPEPVYFQATQQNESHVRFENPAHDFPQFIDYRLDRDTLHARIGNDKEEIEFKFVRN